MWACVAYCPAVFTNRGFVHRNTIMETVLVIVAEKCTFSDLVASAFSASTASSNSFLYNLSTTSAFSFSFLVFFLFVFTHPPATGATQINFTSHLKEIRWHRRANGLHTGAPIARHPCVLIEGHRCLAGWSRWPLAVESVKVTRFQAATLKRLRSSHRGPSSSGTPQRGKRRSPSSQPQTHGCQAGGNAGMGPLFCWTLDLS